MADDVRRSRTAAAVVTDGGLLLAAFLVGGADLAGAWSAPEGAAVSVAQVRAVHEAAPVKDVVFDEADSPVATRHPVSETVAESGPESGPIGMSQPAPEATKQAATPIAPSAPGSAETVLVGPASDFRTALDIIVGR